MLTIMTTPAHVVNYVNTPEGKILRVSRKNLLSVRRLALGVSRRQSKRLSAAAILRSRGLCRAAQRGPWTE
jgi:hypothetical protein